jgi:uncharacterized protein with FMN-binding domain
MRRVISAASGTIVGLIMLLSFKTHPVPATLATPPGALSDTSTTSITSSPGIASTPTTPAAGSPSTGNAGTTTSTVAPAATRTVTGSAVPTRYGPVQVAITVTNGQITAVDAVVYPTQSGRDRQINARAIPQLDQEAVAAQSAKIDTVSGATYTTVGYRTSLQSALDQAGLA